MHFYCNQVLSYPCPLSYENGVQSDAFIAIENYYRNPFLPRSIKLVKVEQSDHFMLLFSKLAGLQQRVAVVEGKANKLLATGYNFLITDDAGLRQGEMIVFWLFHQMHHLL